MIKKILIVDDSTSSRFFLKASLPKEVEYEIFEAENGLIALEKFKEFRPDVVFMDLTMPVMDGLQSLEEILKVDRNATVVIVTADIQKKTVQRAMDLGAFTLIAKPIKKDKIENVVSIINKIKNPENAV
ncbi:response regulator [Candidatus Magnetomonas plexicatena]|uniref:response regulator n=1 Tax=Candidatus Magnetomonas plexicatena TaxID=2552947 RepID=UPI001100ED6A|nr:response regulator [Nitrospirales bacterium LBB_01]